MKRLLTVFAAATLAAWAAPAQQYPNRSQQNTNQPNQSQARGGSAERVQDTTITTDDKTTKTSTDTIYGKVQAYQMNKSIQVTVPGKTESTRTIDLTGKKLTARVAPNVKVGDWVKLVQATDNDGNKMVTVERSNQRAARSMTEEQSEQPGGGQGTAHRRR